MNRSELFSTLMRKITNIRLEHPLRVAIDGVDGSGKTMFADAFAEYLIEHGNHVIRSSIDNFHNPKIVRYEKGADSPEGYYYDSFNNVAVVSNLLESLGPNGSLEYRTAIFDHTTDSKLELPTQIAGDNDILIFDGIFLMRPELNEHWDLRIFLDVPFEAILQRVVKRQMDQEHIGTEKDIEKLYKKRYIPGQMIYLETVDPKKEADVIIDNSDYNNPIHIR